MKRPRLMDSPETKRVYIVTDYVDLEDGKVLAKKSFDVTDEFERICKRRAS